MTTSSERRAGSTATTTAFATGSLARAVERANGSRASAGLASLPDITPHSLRRTWATFAAMVGRDPKWIASQIGHTDPALTFSVYQQVATRRFIDEQAIWEVMRFADEPLQRAYQRQMTRTTALSFRPLNRLLAQIDDVDAIFGADE